MTIELSRLSEPFPLEDIEWRIQRSGMGQKGIFALVIPYITARAIQKRLDDVCGPENWRVEEPRILDVNGKCAFAVGISIQLTQWITKWDVCEPSHIEPAKGGFSGGMKRAGAQWGIGRYLYAIDEVFAEVSDHQPVISGTNKWHYARLSEKHGGSTFYWKSPSLPGWALPKEQEHEVTENDLNELKRSWKEKFAPDSKNPGELREGFSLFVHSICGDFPVSDATCWIRDSWDKCMKHIMETADPKGVSPDVPFDTEPS